MNVSSKLNGLFEKLQLNQTYTLLFVQGKYSRPAGQTSSPVSGFGLFPRTKVFAMHCLSRPVRLEEIL